MTKPIRKLKGVIGEARDILMYEGFGVTGLGQIQISKIRMTKTAGKFLRVVTF
jgi:hypothetical protein